MFLVATGDQNHSPASTAQQPAAEAAAATVTVMDGAAAFHPPPPPPVFRADHPFLFFIQDNATGSILFMGRVMNPAAQ